MTVTAIKLADLIGRRRAPDNEAVAVMTAEKLQKRSSSVVAAATAPVPNAHAAARESTAPENPPRAPQARKAIERQAPEPDTEHQADAAAAAPTDAVVKDIEMLAVKLYAISRRKRGDPAQAMREALRSIEACLSTIKKQH